MREAFELYHEKRLEFAGLDHAELEALAAKWFPQRAARLERARSKDLTTYAKLVAFYAALDFELSVTDTADEGDDYGRLLDYLYNRKEF